MTDKIDILHVGCGGISKAWMSVLLKRKDVEIVGLVDLDIEKAKKMKAEYNLSAKIFNDLDEAISKLKPQVVIDNTIPKAHVDVVTTALENGCNVFGEKPMADTIENALKMVDKANSTNKSYFVMQNRRYLNNIRAYRDIIKDGLIGDLGFLKADFFLGPHFGGFRDQMDSPLILDMAIHTFDQARFISESDPISVYCHEFNPKGSWYNGDASACCIFEMTDDIVFTYNGSWCSTGAQTSWESNWRAQGSEGTAIWDGFDFPYFENDIVNKDGVIEKTRTKRIITKGKEGHLGCIEEMFNALKEKRPAKTDCRDNIKSLLMVMAAIKSSKERKRVYIKDMI